MLSEPQVVYELWEEEPPVFPPHSHLYHLEPIGLGTPMVESLTSYVSRLADMHSVHPFLITTRMIVPCLEGAHPDRAGWTPHTHIGGFWTESGVINGLRKRARNWVQALEKLTLRRDLQFLTMLFWEKVLSPRGLLRPTLAWCPVCYEEWHKTGQTVYQPLLWQLQALGRCPQHLHPLRVYCPYPDCRRAQPHIPQRSRPGYCSKCSRWLGSLKVDENQERVITKNDQREWQLWVSNGMGELLSSAPRLVTPPHREQLTTTIVSYVEKLAGGNESQFANLIHADRRSVWGWVRGQCIPQLEALLRICFSAGITPLQLLTTEDEVKVSSKRWISQDLHAIPTGKRSRKFATEYVREALEAELQSTDYPPPSMRQVAHRLGYLHVQLIKRFPEQCHMISTRYAAYRAQKCKERRQRVCEQVQQATYLLHSQGIYPSERKIKKLPGLAGVFRAKEVRVIWQETLRELGLK